MKHLLAFILSLSLWMTISDTRASNNLFTSDNEPETILLALASVPHHKVDSKIKAEHIPGYQKKDFLLRIENAEKFWNLHKLWKVK